MAGRQLVVRNSFIDCVAPEDDSNDSLLRTRSAPYTYGDFSQESTCIRDLAERKAAKESRLWSDISEDPTEWALETPPMSPMNSERYCKELPLAPGYFYQQAEAARKFSPQMDIDSSVSTSISETSALSAPIWDSAFAKLSAACDSLAARTNPPRHVYVDQFGGQPGACDRLASCAVSAMPAPGPKVPEPLRYVMAMPTGVHVPPEVHVPPGATMSGPAHMASMAQVQGVCLMPVLMPVPMPVVMPGEAMTRPVAMDPMCMPGGARGAVSSPAELARWTAVHPTPFSGDRHRFHEETITMGDVSEDRREFTKREFVGRLSVVTEDQVRYSGVHSYTVQFTAGELSNADGVGFILSPKLPSPKNIQKIISIFANRTGRICIRAHSEVVRCDVCVKRIHVGDWVTTTVDLDSQTAEFTVWPAAGGAPSSGTLNFGAVLEMKRRMMPSLPRVSSGYFACVVKQTGVTVRLAS